MAIFLSGAVAAQTIEVRDRTGALLAALDMVPGSEICLEWHHSVTGGDVADCFVSTHGDLVLSRSYLHDFAAGLGEVEGRGRLKPASDSGYWIVGIDEVMPPEGLAVRIGSQRVGHRLVGPTGTIDLSEIATGQLVWLSVSRGDRIGHLEQVKQ